MLTIGLHNALSAKVRRHRDFKRDEITAEGHNKITIYCGFAPDEAEAAAAALKALFAAMVE